MHIYPRACFSPIQNPSPPPSRPPSTPNGCAVDIFLLLPTTRPCSIIRWKKDRFFFYLNGQFPTCAPIYPLTPISTCTRALGVISQELGTSKLFMALVGTLCITVSVLFAFRKPYLNCVEITKRRSLSRHNDPSTGATTNGSSK